MDGPTAGLTLENIFLQSQKEDTRESQALVEYVEK